MRCQALGHVQLAVRVFSCCRALPFFQKNVEGGGKLIFSHSLFMTDLSDTSLCDLACTLFFFHLSSFYLSFIYKLFVCISSLSHLTQQK